jgi:TRAP-type mannitol/chloroaromatic compound transport system substrate-binding protein
METNTTLLVIVTKEESNGLPTNYQNIFNAAQKTPISHRVVDAQSFNHVATSLTKYFNNGNWTI